MARKRPRGSQFSSKNQPPAKKKQRKHEDYFEKLKKKRCGASLQLFSEESLRSENANLKGTVQTLRRSIGK